MKKKIIGGISVLVVLFVGALTSLFASMSNQELVLSCTTDLVQLPAGLSCSYLTVIRDPDPNVVDSSYGALTVFGLVLNGLDEPDADQERSEDLLEHFLGSGVDLNISHDRGLTPLHIAVLGGSESLAKRFLDAGAKTDVRAKAPESAGSRKRAYDGLTAYEFSALLLAHARKRGAKADIEAQTRLGALFKAAGAKLSVVPKPAPKPAPAPAPAAAPADAPAAPTGAQPAAAPAPTGGATP